MINDFKDKKSMEKFKVEYANNRTVSNQVYDTIRENIINLSLIPGTAMSEKELADKLAVSRTPVREAFIRLAREGLVNIFPQKGTYVSKISISRAKQERFLRESLEKSVLEVFMESHSENALNSLTELLDKQKEALENEDYYDFMYYDDLFHSVFYEETDNVLCNKIVSDQTVDYHRMRYLSVIMRGGVAALNTNQHLELYNYIKEKDIESAQKLLTLHLRKLFKELEIMQDNYPEYFVD